MNEQNILVIGGGGREHALVWKIAQSPLVDRIYCAPGNGGTASTAENVDINVEDIKELIRFAKDNRIDLTVVGPEGPLTLGIVDSFSEAGLKIFGPSKEAAILEGSKAFMKELLTRAGAPTARYEIHDDHYKAEQALERFDERVVIKADGLAAGKGVIICHNRDEARHAINHLMLDRYFGHAGDKVIIEETLEGEEASILAFCDGEELIMMPSSQDHKRIGDGDTGPNTGGMGAYSPAPVITPDIEKWIEENVMRKVLKTMADDGRAYKGILYAGIMITKNGPYVLEFNCRFGDPECQPILMRMDSDIVPILHACVDGNLRGATLDWSADSAVCVVMSAKGYPGSYENGLAIRGIGKANERDNVYVFHAGTRIDERGKVITSGGRVLGVTARAPKIGDAIETAYSAIGEIYWHHAYYRKDIGKKALNR
ncbi:Phosphoribosylamine--glycine ligase [hydrothermal vent metagenome]|uniref:phosphoribosylamine--glycine ligase n=1 Tax=hydrothermal vent metagenome TaxID=652676 RepID=A0A3B1CSX1_9ZZZZ